MEQQFMTLASELEHAMQPGEAWTACFAGEETDFIRFNRGLVRQPGTVRQATLSIELIDGKRHATSDLTLSGDPELDRARLRDALGDLRGVVRNLPDDPYLLLSTYVRSGTTRRGGRIPGPGELVDAVIGAAHGLDFAGIYAGGTIYRGFANALGQRNWHEVQNFNLDCSFHHRADKAVKTSYAGFEWNRAELDSRMAQARDHLERLKTPPRTLDPGQYRAYLTPAAVDELLDMMCWGGFSEKQRRVKQSPLQRLYDGNSALSPLVSISEHAAGGVAPSFQSEGYLKPDRLALIETGEPAATMISPRTAREYGLAANGADGDEAPVSIEMQGGTLAGQDVLAALDTGIYVGNLWYCNFSDRMNCRITGMTRFASFWVEHGRIVAPLNAMRFDDSLFRMFGDHLEALTDTPELILDPHSYEARSTDSASLPGALVRGLALTL